MRSNCSLGIPVEPRQITDGTGRKGLSLHRIPHWVCRVSGLGHRTSYCDGWEIPERTPRRPPGYHGVWHAYEQSGDGVRRSWTCNTKLYLYTTRLHIFAVPLPMIQVHRHPPYHPLSTAARYSDCIGVSSLADHEDNSRAYQWFPYATRPSPSAFSIMSCQS